ncbi:MAG TPA: MFS transporter [Ktedonobacterales bacterium]|nr:MFS transporter [Ktedonobacterales bacterium]
MARHSAHLPEQSLAGGTEDTAAGETPAGAAAGRAGKGLPRVASALRHRNYRLYWGGQIVSLTGGSMQAIGQAWLVLELTQSAFQLGVVGALQFLPVLLFSVFGGVVADRWPKRRIVFVTQSAAMLQAFALWALIATNSIHLWQIYMLALLLGLTTSLDQPTRSAFVVELVGREDLPNAVALNSSFTNLTRIVGPALGGFLIATRGVGDLFLLNGLSFLAMIMALALMRSAELQAQAQRDTDTGGRQTTWQNLREGLAYVRDTPAISLLIVVVGLVLLFGANHNVVLPLIATDVLHAGAQGFGVLSAALGVGSLCAALWLAWSHTRPTIRRVLLGSLAFSVLGAAFALSHSYALSVALLALEGAAETIMGALAITMLQTVAPDPLRGRVTSVYILSFTGSIPLGYVLAGWLSALVGVSSGLLICMLLCLIVTGVGWRWRTPAEQALAVAAHG